MIRVRELNARMGRVTLQVRTMSQSPEEVRIFRTTYHEARYDQIKTRNMVEEKHWVYQNETFLEVTNLLKKQKLIHFNDKIQTVSLDLIWEFYANAQRVTSDEEDPTENEAFVSWVRGKVIKYDWKTINSVLKCKFYDSVCPFAEAKRSDKITWPYNEIKDSMARPGRDWAPTSKISPAKIMVIDLAPIPKAMAYFIHHNLSTNRGGSELISERALLLYQILQKKQVNIGRIIAADMDEIAQSPKKSLGHATVIYLLCKKAGVPDVQESDMLRPAAPLNSHWMKERTTTDDPPRPLRRPHDREASTSAPHQDAQPAATETQPPQSPPIDENSREYRMQMSQFCVMQEFCFQYGLSGRVLTHQTDLWEEAQRFRERFSGPPPAPHFGQFTFPWWNQPVQIGGEILQQPQQPPHQTPPQQQHTHSGHTKILTPIFAFARGHTQLDPTEEIDFDTHMQDGGLGD
ncbi:hypothetical protein KIW84_013229 [Lathyrus oleraceus]|uniref:Putative plant transposon protein domain-containing protein n=1 Tax=Pisum sativum TaxID=3888 RepID=A0A9D5GXS0_PEA|nr:hypothetical protein KIW84_013229 [Pisum sativum]